MMSLNYLKKFHKNMRDVFVKQRNQKAEQRPQQMKETDIVFLIQQGEDWQGEKSGWWV